MHTLKKNKPFYHSEFFLWFSVIAILVLSIGGTAALLSTVLDDGGKNDIVADALLAESQKVGSSKIVTAEYKRNGTLESILIEVNGELERCDVMFEEPIAYATCGDQLGAVTINYRESK